MSNERDLLCGSSVLPLGNRTDAKEKEREIEQKLQADVIWENVLLHADFREVHSERPSEITSVYLIYFRRLNLRVKAPASISSTSAGRQAMCVSTRHALGKTERGENTL